MALQVGTIVIYDSKLYNRTGHVRRWAESLERRFVMNAKMEAPARSGELRAGIIGGVDRIGPRHLQVVIQSTAPHSLYVLGGTTGPIMSRRLWGFRSRTGLDVPRGGTRSGNVFFPFGYDMEFLRRNGYALRVRAGKGYPERYALQVSGQEPNHFFARAAERTARRHSSIRGFDPRVT